MVELKVLGGIDLRDGAGRSLDPVVAQPKRLALLAYLALAGADGFLRRDKLLALFWPDLDDSHARNALSKALHFLRRGIDNRVVVIRGDELRLDADLLTCDAVAFYRLIAAGRAADALALYRGDLLDGVFVEEAAEFERWLEDERERLRRAAAAAAATLADEEEAAGRPGDAAVWRRRVLALRPDDESALLRLVADLDAAGDRAGALREYERGAHRLLEDYGIEPSPAMRQQVATIRSRHPEITGIIPRGPETAVGRYGGTAPGRDGGTLVEASPPRRVRTRRALLAGVLLAAVPGTIWLTRTRESQAGDTAAPPIGSVAVLPLANRSDDSTGEYLADGITDDLISRLARVPGLRVAARTSVFTYKRTTDPVRHIANRLNVDAIVEGTARRTADSVRVDVRLLDPGTDVVLWTSEFEGTPADLPGIEQSILEGTTRALGYRHAARPVAAAGGAYDSYLKGKYYFDKYEIDDVRRSLQYFSQAVDRDPSFALGYAGMSQAYAELSTRWIPADQAMPRARAAAERALRLDSTLPEAHVALSRVQAYWERDWAGAGQSLRLALAVGPGLATVHEAYGLLLTFQGRIDSALAHLRLAQQLDPLSPAIGFEAVWPLLMGRRYEEALEAYRHLVESYETDGMGASIGEIHALQGDYATAIPMLESYRRDHPGMDARYYAVLARAYHAVGRRAESQAILDMLLSHSRERDFGGAYMLGLLYAGIGDHPRALEWLERCDSTRNENMVLIKVDPELAVLENEPRYQALVRRMGLE